MAEEKQTGGGAEKGARKATEETKNLEGQSEAAKVGPVQGEPPAGPGTMNPMIGFLVAGVVLAVIVLIVVL